MMDTRKVQSILSQVRAIRRKLRKRREVMSHGRKWALRYQIGKLENNYLSIPKVVEHCEALTSTPTPTSTPTTTAPDLTLFSNVQPIIQSQCMSCHGTWQNTETFFVSSGRVIPGNLASSSLYTYLNSNPDGFQPAYMPKNLPALATSQIQTIRGWILSIGITPTVTPTAYRSVWILNQAVDLSEKLLETTSQSYSTSQAPNLTYPKEKKVLESRVQKSSQSILLVRG